jgi:hypothetical protein
MSATLIIFLNEMNVEKIRKKYQDLQINSKDNLVKELWNLKQSFQHFCHNFTSSVVVPSPTSKLKDQIEY